MKLIVITSPEFLINEADAINGLFRAGLQVLHLRKPNASAGEIENLIRQIDSKYRNRIVLHEHFLLAERYCLKGIHLNMRNSKVPVGYKGHVSCSCHTMEEVSKWKPVCDYIFLSPIFDSISKTEYRAAFTSTDLLKARNDGVIDSKVIALGGICKRNMAEAKEMGFGGVAVLGDIWNHLGKDFISHFMTLKRAAHMVHPIILSIAGSDPSGGAGIQADIKTISALGGYAAAAITALTVQNTLGVQAVYATDRQIVKQQITAVMDDLTVDAVKIGMVHDASIADAIAKCLTDYPHGAVVYDPVMVSTNGHKLMTEETVQTICDRLLPLCTLITPNLHEARLLASRPINTIEDMEQAALYLSECYHTAILIKGGHLEGHSMCDILSCHGKVTRFTAPKVESRNLHGTGCTLSSAIATYLAMGNVMEEAIKCAKAYVSQAIIEARNLHIGQGQGPLWHGSFI